MKQKIIKPQLINKETIFKIRKDLKFINYSEIPNLDSNINFYLNLLGSILIILIPIILYYRNKNKKNKNETIREFLNNVNNEK